MRLTLMLVLTLAAVAAACGDTTGDAATEYEVAVSFNTSYVEDDIDQVADFLRGFDSGLEFLVQESFPPTGVARLRTDTPAFCPTVEDEIEAKSYVASVSCAEAEEPPLPGDPDEPVEATPDGTS